MKTYLLILSTISIPLLADSCSTSDLDQDGYVDCATTDATTPCDCDDQNPSRYPDAIEIYDNIDDDCDGVAEWMSSSNNDTLELIPVIPTGFNSWASASDYYLVTGGQTTEPTTRWNVYTNNGSQCLVDSVTTVRGGQIAVGSFAYWEPFNANGCAMRITSDGVKTHEYEFDLNIGDDFNDVKVCGDSIMIVGTSSNNERTESVGTFVSLNQDLTPRWSSSIAAGATTSLSKVECQANGNPVAMGSAYDAQGNVSHFLAEADHNTGQTSLRWMAPGDLDDFTPDRQGGYRAFVAENGVSRIYFLDSDFNETQPSITTPPYYLGPVETTYGVVLPNGKMVLMSECEDEPGEYRILFERIDGQGQVERDLHQGGFDRNFIGSLTALDDGSILYSFYGLYYYYDGYNGVLVGQMDGDLNEPPYGELILENGAIY